MAVYLFDVPAYFILLRETLEVTIILAVLLGFIDNLSLGNETLKKKFKKQIWIGAAAGLGFSLLIGLIFIIVFYAVKTNLWEESEAAWEGAFSLIASVVITAMSLSMVQAQKWKSKWENKLKGATEQYLKKHEEGNKWALILLPLTVVCREGVETIVFIAGIGFNNPASGLPLPVFTGLLSGFLIGYLIYKGSHRLSLKLFFGFTTTLLLLMAAGLFSNSIHDLQEATGTYEHVIWELKCCKSGQFWSLMKNIFGWRNKATVGTTVGYFVYWFTVGILALFLIHKDKKRASIIIDEENIVQLNDDKDGQLNDDEDGQLNDDKDGQLNDDEDEKLNDEKDEKLNDEKDEKLNDEKDEKLNDEKDEKLNDEKDEKLNDEKDERLNDEKDEKLNDEKDGQ